MRALRRGAPLTDPRQPQVQAWSGYWSSGVLHSCASSFGGNYAGAIAAFWRDVFAGLPRGARMLDLASGNGALPQLALEQVADAGFRVDAVDLAALAPGWDASVAHGRLRFHPGVALESLPFDDAAFDLVTSQYGIEYAHWPDALHEALRVCGASGTMACVVHHAGSLLVRIGRQETANLSLLLRDDGLLAAAACVLPWAARAGDAGGNAMTTARQAYNEAMAAVADALEGNPVPDVLLSTRHQVHSLVAAVRNGAVAPERALEMLGEFRDELAMSRVRTDGMVASARDRDGIEAMVSSLHRLRPAFSASIVELRQEEGLLGWGVVFGPDRVVQADASPQFVPGDVS